MGMKFYVLDNGFYCANNIFCCAAKMGGGQNLERPKCRTADISEFRNLKYLLK